MNPAAIYAVSQIIASAIEIWRQNANKPDGWMPTQADWDALLALNQKTAEDYVKEAQAALGTPSMLP